MIDYAYEIRRRFGNVRRARGCWLYTEKNVRLLDMFLDGGAAVLGHRGGRAKLVLKNALDRGLAGGMPSAAEAGLHRAGSALFGTPGRVSWFYSRARALKACFGAGIPAREWLPWSDGALPADSGGALVFPAPFPWGAAPEFSGFLVFVPASCAPVSLVRDGQDTAHSAGKGLPDSLEEVPALSCGDAAPPPFLAAVTRAVYDLRARLSDFCERDFARAFPDSALRESPWRRNGAHLILRGELDIPDERYVSFFCACLDRGIFISPSLKIPSVIPLPGISSPKEITSVKSMLKKLPAFSEEAR